MNSGRNSVNETTDISSAEIELALGDILNSTEFANADRLRSFLEYVVRETLEGRGGDIKAKTIAQDVYRRDAASDGDPENVVRVDARRLRRRLTDYYTDGGMNARVRVHIDSGGYTPRFERIAHHQESKNAIGPGTEPGSPGARGQQKAASFRYNRLIIAAVVLLVIAAGLVEYFVFRGSDDVPEHDNNMRRTERQALLEKSPKTLQAVDMTEQARGLIYPMFDLTRQKLALGFFQQAIQLDPGYFGGYAGAAQTLGTLALLGPEDETKEGFRAQAREMAKKAIELNPTAPWAQSAASWAEFANRNHDEAIRLSARAYALGPDSPNIVENYAAVALSNGNFQLALDLTKRAIENRGDRSGTVNRNIYATANLFLGNPEETLAALSSAALHGDAVSSIVMALLSVANHALGDMERARKYASDLQRVWPNAPIDKIISKLHRHQYHADEIIWRLKDAGWEPVADRKAE